MLALCLSTAPAIIAAGVYGIAKLDRLVIGLAALHKAPPENAHKVVRALAQMQVNTRSEQK
jgi:type III secretion system FlhB-like substrate exporter